MTNHLTVDQGRYGRSTSMPLSVDPGFFVPSPDASLADTLLNLKRVEAHRKRQTDLRTKLSRFLPMAQAVAAQSKDPSTKVGAVILGPNFETRSTGWNGAPRGSKADEDERFQVRETKYQWVVHAEANAIAAAARVGTPLADCQMVVTHAPCSVCARLIIQAGIVVVAAPAPTEQFAADWAVELEVTRRMFKECGVEFVTIET